MLKHPAGPAAAKLFVAFVLLWFAAIGLREAADAGSPTAQGCFSAVKWSADDGDRPCARLNLYEDGSYRVKVREADGDRWRQR
jgi:hypothetical protein